MGNFFTKIFSPTIPSIGRKKASKSTSAAQPSAAKSKSKPPPPKAGKGAKGKSRYEEEFTEERVMSYTAPPGTLMTDKFVPGAYMTESYTSHVGGNQMEPARMSASSTKTGKPAKPHPTAGKSPYLDFPNDIIDRAEFPGIYDTKGLQTGGIVPGMSRMRKISHYANNQPTLPGVNLGDAMPLSPMVEHEAPPSPAPMNNVIILLTLVFFSIVLVRRK
jgi:hypothetical protein